MCNDLTVVGSETINSGLKIKSSPDGKPRVETFDGDEGAIHAPQSEDARREVAGLMSVTCNIMNGQTNSNIAGVVFDALTGSYLLSLPETVVDEGVFMRARMGMESNDGFQDLYKRLEKYHVPKNSGRALLSALFPPDFYYLNKSDGGRLIIREGIIVEGTMNKDNIGSASGSVIQAMYKDYGQYRTTDFLTDIYRVAGYYMDSNGFSVGLDDCFLSGEAPQKTIEYEIQRAKMLVKSMGGKLLDPMEEERRERQIRGFVDTAKNLGGKITKENMSADNSFNVMAKSGAKGSTFNIASITGILGQQFLAGQRMPETRGRSLQYFEPGDLDPAARGFVVNSYMTGLSAAESFYSLISARESVSMSSNSISSSGHMHHKLTKNMETLIVNHDGSVRNNTGVIYQFAYGEDGFNPEVLEAQTTKTGQFASFIDLRRSAAKINGKYGF